MSTPEQKLKKLENLLNLLDESLTKEEFVKSFEAVVNLILKVQKDLQDKNEVAIDSLEKMFEKLALKLESANKEDITEIKVKIEGALKDQQAGMNLIYDKMKDIRSGRDADEEKIVEKVLARIPPPPQFEKVEPETPEQTRNKLEYLKGKERLRIEAIAGLKEAIEELKERKPLGDRILGMGGGKRPIYVQEVPSGTLDGSNREFTLTTNYVSDSVSISVNGVEQRPGSTREYILSGKTITFAADNIPVEGDNLWVKYEKLH